MLRAEAIPRSARILWLQCYPGVPGAAPGWKLDQNPKAIPRLAGILWLQCYPGVPG